ncbi:MAG: deoxyribose-phosphate aldolase [Thermocladium sp.]
MSQEAMDINLARLIDHTNLKPYATTSDIERLIIEARELGTYAICINPIFIKFAREYINRHGFNLRIATVVDFPFGDSTTDVRIEMINKYAIHADELDIVAPMSLVKSKQFKEVEQDLKETIKAAHDLGKIIKVIVEDAYTTLEEKRELYRIVMMSNADFIKTSTGFEEKEYAAMLGNKVGAQIENVKLMAELSLKYNPRIGIKASGGIHSQEQALMLLRASGKPADPAQFRIGASRTRDILGS